jgi:hypothetical protein
MTIGTRGGNGVLNINLRKKYVYYEIEMKMKKKIQFTIFFSLTLTKKL